MTALPTAEPFVLEFASTGPRAGIAVLRLDQPGRSVVVLDHGLIQRIEATLKTIPNEAIGLILASASERVFIAGADLKTISTLDDAQLDKYLAYGQRVFGMLSQLPFPTAAALNGAALGGGLEIAMHCDGLVGAPAASGKPYPLGLPEAGLCLCPGWGGTNLLTARIDPAKAINMTASGKTMVFDDACEAGFFDRVACDNTTLLDEAAAWILDIRSKGRIERDGAPHRWIGRNASATLAALDKLRAEHTLPQTASAQAIIEAIDAGLAQGWQAALDTERTRLVHLRNSPAGKAAIHAFFERTAAKS